MLISSTYFLYVYKMYWKIFIYLKIIDILTGNIYRSSGEQLVHAPFGVAMRKKGKKGRKGVGKEEVGRKEGKKGILEVDKCTGKKMCY